LYHFVAKMHGVLTKVWYTCLLERTITSVGMKNMKHKPIIEAKNISFAYDDSDVKAVSGVSLTVDKGAFVCILGRNGSGKSTLAKLFNALAVPQQGELTVAGIAVNENCDVFDVRSRCGMVFQNPDNQLVATIVEEDVAFGLENMGVEPDEIRRRVDEALAQVGMSEFAQAAPHNLSGGQKQRIAIAGVIAMRPDIIVFDESTAMLDPSGRKEVLQTAKRLNREEGITVVWITHFMEEAAQADHLYVMDDGDIALSGTPKEVFEHAAKVRTLGLDVPEMTELAGELRRAGIELPSGILTVEEMAVELCRLRSRN